MMSDPLVGVASTKYVPGADTLAADKATPALTTLPLSEALRTAWDTDAHFVLYQLVKDGVVQPGWPRCNKPVLDAIRQNGCDLVVPFVALDYDNPGHADWTPGGKEAFELRLVDASGGLPLAMGWTYLYFTKGGARLVYVLSQPIAVEDAEALILGMVRDFLAYGIEMDTSAADWTRLFRCPSVSRDNVPTGGQWYFELIDQPYELDPSSVVPGDRQHATKYSKLERFDVPMPEFDWAREHALVDRDPRSGKKKQSYWCKEAKKALQGRECYPCLFEHAALAPRGSRNSAVQRLVGECINVLFVSNIPNTTAQLVFALFFPALEQLNAQDPNDPEDFFATGWKAILQYWAKEEAKFRALQEEQAQQQAAFQEQQTDLTSRMLAGVREWAKDLVPRDNQEATWWLGQHLIAASQTHFHIMRASGYYDPIGVPKTLLCARVRELGVETLIPLTKVEEGKQKPVQAQELIDRHATTVGSLEGAVGVKGCHISNPGEDNAVLRMRLFGRKALQPQWDVEVDAWLQQFAGENYDRICTWIGHALNFEGGPICALSVAGGQGCGKKLFYQGLAECIDTEVVASSREFGQYQGLLMQTPFVVINEGLHEIRGGMHPADTFRHYVSGDPIYVRKLYHEPVLIKNPLRVMFFANNMDVVQQLTGNRDLSPEDREALAMRILHHDVAPMASEWLRGRGGLDWTRGWIGGDDGSPSHYRVARHFLFLHANRPKVPRGNRLLVEGNMTDELIRTMSTRSGSAPLVIETLIKMVENEGHLDGFHIDGYRIYVTTSAVVNFFRASPMSSANTTLNQRTVGKVLKGLIVAGSSRDARTLQISESVSKKAKWREIHAALLLDEAIEHGYQCTKLERIAAGQEAMQSAVELGIRHANKGLSWNA